MPSPGSTIINCKASICLLSLGIDYFSWLHRMEKKTQQPFIPPCEVGMGGPRLLPSSIAWGQHFGPEHATDQLEHSSPQYRAAYGFDHFENAIICQMPRSSSIVGLLARLPRPQIGPGHRNLHQASVLCPDVPSPDTSGGSLAQKKLNTDLSPSKIHNQGSPSKGAHLTSNVYVTNSYNKEWEVLLTFNFEYLEEVISQNLDMAEDRDDFVETMAFNGVPEEASGFIWEMYFGLVGICF
ncbi:hypothetical protein ARMGADRAFT_1035689 [Armillaria gallica]|uniref:Uncharacterized protein n=1 Tax=Armillaria gallica TaxID=47427 RepID=A0A2H3CT80_ARMGA|nr:hypothetical protein ARMGADRAFT_1035689 [Armillaria gallica]